MRFYVLLLGLLVACSAETTTQTEALALGNPHNVPVCEETCGVNDNKVYICHRPPGNPDNERTLCTGAMSPNGLIAAVNDSCGQCEYEPTCGDEVCEAPENKLNCPEDCGVCPPVCGDEVCQEYEDCETCAADCGECETCGNQVCDGNESCETCVEDCGECGPQCGDQVCEEGETCSDCPSDCGECPPVCGDEVCEVSENCENCATDCGECPAVCGNGECSDEENCEDCREDCGVCIEGEVPPPPASPLPERGVSGGGCNSSNNVGGLSLLVVILGLLMLSFRSRKGVVALTIIGIVGLLEGPVLAQSEKDFNTERFEMTMDRHGVLNVEGAQVDPKDSWGMNVGATTSNDSFVVNERLPGEKWNRVSSPVHNRVGASVSGYYVVLPKLAVGAELPLVLHQDQEGSSLGGLNSLSTSGFGDMRLMGKLQILDEEKHKVDVALGASATLPTASSDEFMGERSPTLAPYVSVSGGLNQFKVVGNLGYRTRGDTTVANLRLNDEAFAKLGVSYGWNRNELGATVSVNTVAKDFFEKDNGTYSEAMLGYTRYYYSGLSSFVGVGRGLNEGVGAPDWRVFAGLRYTFEARHPAPKCGPLGGTDCPKVKKAEPKVRKKGIAPKPAPVPQEKTVLVVADSFFKFDDSSVNERHRNLVAEVATAALRFRELTGAKFDLVVYGHTDSIGATRYNVSLGERRALAVSKVLQDAGVPEDMIVVVSKGESEPVDTNSTEKGRARNRRVEIKIAPPQQPDIMMDKTTGPGVRTLDGFGELDRK